MPLICVGEFWPGPVCKVLVLRYSCTAITTNKSVSFGCWGAVLLAQRKQKNHFCFPGVVTGSKTALGEHGGLRCLPLVWVLQSAGFSSLVCTLQEVGQLGAATTAPDPSRIHCKDGCCALSTLCCGRNIK